jgi:hypothetical protein
LIKAVPDAAPAVLLSSVALSPDEILALMAANLATGAMLVLLAIPALRKVKPATPADA